MAENPMRKDVEFYEQYDQEDDVYYVSFRTGEPSLTSEQDDALLIEVGMFSGMPTGFRILNYTKHKAAANTLKHGMKTLFQNIIQAAQNKAKSESLERENRISRFLDKAIA